MSAATRATSNGYSHSQGERQGRPRSGMLAPQIQSAAAGYPLRCPIPLHGSLGRRCGAPSPGKPRPEGFARLTEDLFRGSLTRHSGNLRPSHFHQKAPLLLEVSNASLPLKTWPPVEPNFLRCVRWRSPSYGSPESQSLVARHLRTKEVVLPNTSPEVFSSTALSPALLMTPPVPTPKP